MSKRSYRILLDTSFLLPVLGFETNRRVMNAFPRLRGHVLHYSSLSLLEALWKIAKQPQLRSPETRGQALQRIREGAESIEAWMTVTEPGAWAASEALRLYHLGHRDMIDNLLYATALEKGLRFLTVDEAFIGFLRRSGLPLHPVLLPEELP